MARGFNRSNADGAQGHTAPAWRCGQVLKGNLRAIAAFVAAAKFRLPTMCLTRSTTALPLILASILTRPAWSQSIQFTDVSVAAGLGGFNFTPNTLAVPGLNEWIMGGIGVGDFNGDGWPDLFIPRGGSGTDRLYINLGNGTFENQAVAWGIAQAHAGNGVACGDFDRDGDIDIYVSSYGTAQDNLGQIGRHRLYRNDGGFFTEVAVAFGVHVSAPTGSVANGAAWGDFDLDGDLDLAVAGWSSVHTGNRLFRNEVTCSLMSHRRHFCLDPRGVSNLHWLTSPGMAFLSCSSRRISSRDARFETFETERFSLRHKRWDSGLTTTVWVTR
jgi:hypothetical protein